MNIKAKLILVLVIVSLVPLAVVGWYSLEASRDSITNEVFNHLVSVRDAKKAQITRLYENKVADIRVLAESSHIGAALDAFSSAVRDGQADMGQFDFFESIEYGTSFRRFIEEYGYYDLMLVTELGDIVYSTRREADFAQNLITGPLKESLLGRHLERGLLEVVATDFQIYEPSGNRVIAFLIAPIGGDGSSGAVVLKVTIDAVNAIMLERSGMGETGEAYLVGPDKLMRSDSYLDTENRTVAKSFANPAKGSVDTAATRAALAGESGDRISKDYRGETVLSSYLPVTLGDLTFALIAEIDRDEAFASITRLQRIVAVLAAAVTGLMLISAFLLANVITRPILSLTRSSIDIAGGDLDQEVTVERNDELGVLSENFNKMRLSIRRKIDQLEENRQALREANETLEERVEERTRELAKTYHVISQSIKYAGHIQRSVLPPEDIFRRTFAEHFVIWDPRDVVGGDIYWCREWGDGALLMLGDCTGHGVPGAFMTLISTGALDRALIECPVGEVARLVQRMHQLVQQTLGQDGDSAESDDGLELGACFVSPGGRSLTFVGARFDIFVVSGDDVSRFKGDKKGIGYREIPLEQKFREITIDVGEGSTFYMTTDGAVDQISEENQRSFGKRRFETLLRDIQGKAMDEQRDSIREAVIRHQGAAPRLDDIAVIGFKVA